MIIGVKQNKRVNADSSRETLAVQSIITDDHSAANTLKTATVYMFILTRGKMTRL